MGEGEEVADERVGEAGLAGGDGLGQTGVRGSFSTWVLLYVGPFVPGSFCPWVLLYYGSFCTLGPYVRNPPAPTLLNLADRTGCCVLSAATSPAAGA